ncbi:MAG: hypothetical protein HY904_01130 [Deltaproteobacteria bacterium]|nr:hypothetical protein [Deltaproteobacteria bacterium]
MGKTWQVRGYPCVLVAALLAPVMTAHAHGGATGSGSQLVPYAGFLEQDGIPVNGYRDFTFRLFDVETGGTELWSESHAGVSIAAGQFAVHLGSQHALADHILASSDLYLEVAVLDPATSTLLSLSGRQRLGAVPYAYRGAPRADFLVDGNLTVASNVSIGGDRANFPAANGALVANASSQGFWSAADGWKWRWDNGTLAVGSVPMNVVSREYTDVFSTTSTTFVDVTNFSATITPSSTSSRVLVMANVTAGMGGAIGGSYRVLRESTPIAVPPGVSGYTPVTGATFYGGSNDANNNETSSAIYLDSPGTTAPVTYKVQVYSPQAGWLRVNAMGSDAANQGWSMRARSSLTLMEIK